MKDELAADLAEKARRYVSDPSEVPEGYEVHEGPEGGLYYETEGTSEGQARIGPHDPDAEEEVGEETEEEPGEELPEGRTIPDDELRENGLDEDLFNAVENGTEEDLEAVIEAYDGRHVKSEAGVDYYTTLDEDDEYTIVEAEEDYATATPFDEWIYGDWTKRGGMEEFLGYDIREEYNEDFWRMEDTTYHGTTPNSAAKIILSEELQRRNNTRGLGNRSVGRAVFTSRNGTFDAYGAVDFEIDLEEMKEDGFTPMASPEPQVAEARAREAVAREVGMHDFHAEIPHDISPDTAVIHEDIPLQYLSLNAAQGEIEAIEEHINEMVEEGNASQEEAEEALQWLEQQQPETKEAILKDMTIGMFSALADETPAPYVAEVDETYNDVTGETPDGETAEGDINRKEFAKERRYVDDPSEVPEGYDVQEGPQGGLYYETTGVDGEAERDEGEEGINRDPGAGADVPVHEVKTLDIATPLFPEDVSRGDEVTVWEGAGNEMIGTVTGFVEGPEGQTLADVDFGDGGSALVGRGYSRAMFPPGTDIPDGDIVQEEIGNNGVVQVILPDGESVVGYYDGDSTSAIFVQPTLKSGAEDAIEIPKAQLADPDAQISEYETDTLVDVPGIDPLPPDEGGFNDVPETDDPQELANSIRTHDDWSEAAGMDISEPIDEEQLTEAKEVIGGVLSRANDPEIARVYAQRTVIGDNANRACNGARKTPYGQTMNSMTRDDKEWHGERAVRHEMGHGVVQLGGHSSRNNRNAHDMEYWPDEIDPTDGEDFQQYLMGDGPRTDHVGKGWDVWSDEVRQGYSEDEWDTDVENDVAAELGAGDVVRFEAPPDERIDSTTWEVTEVREPSHGRTEVFLRDGQGHYISKELAEADDYGVTDGEGVAGEMRYARDVDAVAWGYSDSDAAMRNQETRFTGNGGKTVDEIREETEFEGWEEKVDNLVSQANRAFYEMHLKNEYEGVEEPIIDGYSSTTAAEVPSQIHEMFQSDKDSRAERAAEVAEMYPHLVAAYLELWQPAERVREELAGVEGVTV